MTAHDMLWVEANMYSHNGEHWANPEKKERYMRYKGEWFLWDAEREIWNFYDEVKKRERS